MAELIAFFSRRDENYLNGTIRMLDIGNTEVIAGMIRELTHADLFQIEPMQKYSKNYNESEKHVRSLRHILTASPHMT